MTEKEQIRIIRESLRTFNRWAGVLKSDPYGLGLSLSQASALVDIDRSVSLRPHELVARLNLEKSSISRLMNVLIKKSLIVAKSHKGDGRGKILCLTKRGQQVVEIINHFSDESISKPFRILNRQQQKNLVTAAQNLEFAVQKMETKF